MSTVKAKTVYELEKNGDRTIVHFEPTLGPTLKEGMWLAFFLLSLFGGWFPGAVITLYVTENGWHIVIVWFLLIAFSAIFGVREAFKPKKRKAGPKNTIVLHKNKIDAPHYGKHRSFDRADLGKIYTQAPDISFTYTARRYSNDHDSQKAKAEKEGKVSFSVTADYGAEQVVIIDKCLTKQQADAIRDLISKWKDNPDTVLENNENIVDA